MSSPIRGRRACARTSTYRRTASSAGDKLAARLQPELLAVSNSGAVRDLLYGPENWRSQSWVVNAAPRWSDERDCGRDVFICCAVLHPGPLHEVRSLRH